MSSNRDVDSSHSTNLALVSQPQTTKGTMTGFSLQQPVQMLSESVHHGMVAFYTLHKTLLIISVSSDKKGAPRAKAAIPQLKKGKTIFAQQAESLREPLHSSYRHAGDFVLICQATPHEREGALGSYLDSAKLIHRDFSQFYDDFTKTLVQFVTQKSVLVVSQDQDTVTQPDSAANTNLSTNDAVDKLFTSLHAIPTHLQEIISFWQDHIEMLSDYITAPSTRLLVFDDTNHHNLAETWLDYQRTLLNASSSIAESVDAMSVNPTTIIPNASTQGTGTRLDDQNSAGFLQVLWRFFSWMDFRR